MGELVAYAHRAEGRRARIERACETRLPLSAGSFTAVGYRDLLDGREHLALTLGDVSFSRPLVYVHRECLAGDALRAHSCGCGARLHAAMERIAAAGRGVVVYVRNETRCLGLPGAAHGESLDPDDVDVVRHILADLGLGAQLFGFFPGDEDLGFELAGARAAGL